MLLLFSDFHAHWAYNIIIKRKGGPLMNELIRQLKNLNATLQILVEVLSELVSKL